METEVSSVSVKNRRGVSGRAGIGRDTVLVSFAVFFSGFLLALSIAFGLGGKDVAREYLEKRLKKDRGSDIRPL